MTVALFLEKYLKFALESEKKTGLSAIATLSQCALETGWGQHCPGNMMFGVKASKGTPIHQKQLLLTTEYSTRADLKFPVIVSVTPVIIKGVKKYKYRVKDWFRKYDSPEESFNDHAALFQRISRYAAAWEVRHDYNKFFDAIQGIYATDPGYSGKLKSIAANIKKHIQ